MAISAKTALREPYHDRIPMQHLAVPDVLNALKYPALHVRELSAFRRSARLVAQGYQIPMELLAALDAQFVPRMWSNRIPVMLSLLSRWLPNG